MKKSGKLILREREKRETIKTDPDAAVLWCLPFADTK